MHRKPSGVSDCRDELVPGHRRHVYEVVRREVVDRVADEDAAVAALDHHRVRVLVTLERRVSAGPDLEVAQLAGERGQVEQHLPGHVPERHAAVALVVEHVDLVPTQGVELAADRRRRHRRKLPQAAGTAVTGRPLGNADVPATASTKARVRSPIRSPAASSEPPISSIVSLP